MTFFSNIIKRHSYLTYLYTGIFFLIFVLIIKSFKARDSDEFGPDYFKVNSPFRIPNPDPHRIKDTASVNNPVSLSDYFETENAENILNGVTTNKTPTKDVNKIPQEGEVKPNQGAKPAADIDDIDDNNGGLYKNYMSKSINPSIWEKMTLIERIKSRSKRYAAYMSEFTNISQNDKNEEGDKLRNYYKRKEIAESKIVEKNVEWDENDYLDGAIQPAGSKILLLTADDGKENNLVGGILQASRENRKEYCAYHGYLEYYVDLAKYDNPNRNSSWAKIDAIKEAFEENPEVEWVWLMNPEVLITNPEIDLAKHILNKKAIEERLSYGKPICDSTGKFFNGLYMEKGEVDMNDINIIISQNDHGLDTSSMFIKRSYFTTLFLEAWGSSQKSGTIYPRHEQDALIHLFAEHEKYQQNFGLVPQRIMNSNAGNSEISLNWKKDDLAFHLTNCANPGDCEAIYYDMWTKRIQVPKKYRLGNRINLASLKIGNKNIK